MRLGLSVKAKIRLAQLLRALIVLPLSVLGRSTTILECTRGGVKWKLDLNEGIDLSIFVLGSYEPQTLTILRRLVTPGSTVLDIGANIGAHTLHLAKQVGESGRVIAIEPTNWACSKLHGNIELNPSLQKIICVKQVALTSIDGRLPNEFHSSWSLVSDEDRHPMHMGILKSASNAVSLTLDKLVDDLKLTRVDFIKIDVDGFEIEVFAGGRQVIQKYLPVIVLELSPDSLRNEGRDFNVLIDFLEEFNYSLYDEFKGNLLPKNRIELLRRIPKAGGINAIAAQSPLRL